MAPVYDEWDRGTAWLILLACFVLQVLQAGSFATFGLFMVEYLDHFQCRKITVAWIGAVLMSLIGLSGVFTGYVVQRFGFRATSLCGSVIAALGYILSAFVHNVYLLYLTHGFIAAIGHGLWVVCANTCAQHFFLRRRALAQSIVMTGLSVGVFFWSPLVQFLLDYYSWRGTLILVGAIQLHGLPAGALLRMPKHRSDGTELTGPEQQEEPTDDCQVTAISGNVEIVQPVGPTSGESEGSSSVVWFSLLRDPAFMLYCVATICVFVAHYAPYTFIPIRAEGLGISKPRVAFLLSILGVVGGVSRIFFGWLADFPRVHRVLMFGASSILTGVATALSVTAVNFPGIAFYCTIYSVLAAVYCSVLFTIVSDITGMKQLATGNGFILCCIGIGLLISNPIGGVLLDRTGDSGLPFLVFGVIQVLGGVASLLIVWYNRRYQSQARLYGPNGTFALKK